MRSLIVLDLDGFRAACRGLVAAQVAPGQLTLVDGHTGQRGLADEEIELDASAPALTLPRELGEVVHRVAHHRDPGRWDALYRVIFRTCHGERSLIHVAADPDVSRLLAMNAAIRRDVHKTHAFVRFRRVEVDEGERFVAFHRPDHRIMPLATPFFVERFAAMRWSILTPDECAHWDGETLSTTPGVPAREAPAPDELEAMFRTYYRATFNPARLNLRAMRAEMPKKHWATLPETTALDDMIREATGRVDAMLTPAEPGRRGRLVPSRKK